jgi:hypothetical protein
VSEVSNHEKVWSETAIRFVLITHREKVLKNFQRQIFFFLDLEHGNFHSNSLVQSNRDVQQYASGFSAVSEVSNHEKVWSETAIRFVLIIYQQLE